MTPIIAPSMTVQQIAELCAEHSTPDCEVYVRIESIRGKPIAHLVREKHPHDDVPMFLRRQAE